MDCPLPNTVLHRCRRDRSDWDVNVASPGSTRQPENGWQLIWGSGGFVKRRLATPAARSRLPMARTRTAFPSIISGRATTSLRLPARIPAAPINYGISEAKFDRHFKNGEAMQWNLFVEHTFARSWFASVGYSASHSTNLMNRNFPINSIQQLPPSLLSSWRSQYIASNGVTNPQTVQIPNPFQPTTGPLLKFTGTLGNATLDQLTANYPYPLNYNSLQLRLLHAFTGTTSSSITPGLKE